MLLTIDARCAYKVFTHYFFAVELPTDICCGLQHVQQTLASGLPERIAWVKPEQFHLSLRYLGACVPEMLSALGAHITRSLTPPGPLQIEISPIAPDPQRRKTRRIVARIWEPTGDLTWVWRTIDVAARAAGFGPDCERCAPHITLGRVQPPQRITLVEIDAALLHAQLPGAFATSEIALIRSDVSPHGSKHSRVGLIRLPTGPRPTIPSVNW